MWNLKYDINEFIYETETDSENRLVVAKWGGVGEGRTRSVGLADENHYTENG